MLGGHQNQENREGDQIEVAERKREEFMEAMRIIRGIKEASTGSVSIKQPNTQY